MLCSLFPPALISPFASPSVDDTAWCYMHSYTPPLHSPGLPSLFPIGLFLLKKKPYRIWVYFLIPLEELHSSAFLNFFSPPEPKQHFLCRLPIPLFSKCIIRFSQRQGTLSLCQIQAKKNTVFREHTQFSQTPGSIRAFYTNRQVSLCSLVSTMFCTLS